MPELSQSQLNMMNETLIDLMNIRLKLTRVGFIEIIFPTGESTHQLELIL